MIRGAKWLRRRTEEEWSHTAMLWRCDPTTFDYTFPGDESFMVISGSVKIELTDTGDVVDLRDSEVASFPKGTPSVWTVVEPIVKFTVFSG